MRAHAAMTVNNNASINCHTLSPFGSRTYNWSLWPKIWLSFDLWTSPSSVSPTPRSFLDFKRLCKSPLLCFSLTGFSELLPPLFTPAESFADEERCIFSMATTNVVGDCLLVSSILFNNNNAKKKKKNKADVVYCVRTTKSLDTHSPSSTDSFFPLPVKDKHWEKEVRKGIDFRLSGSSEEQMRARPRRYCVYMLRFYAAVVVVVVYTAERITRNCFRGCTFRVCVCKKKKN